MLTRFGDEEIQVGSLCIRKWILRGCESGTDCGFAILLGHVIGPSDMGQRNVLYSALVNI